MSGAARVPVPSEPARGPAAAPPETGQLMNLHRTVATPALACILLSLAACREEGDAIPKDFRVVAEFGPGGFTDPRVPWKATINRDGRVIREIPGFRKETRRAVRPLDRDDLVALRDAIAAADFFSLPGAISAPVTDAATLLVAVTEGGKTREVKVYGVSELGKDPRVQRFLKVWGVLHRIVPSPNGDPEGGSGGSGGAGA